MLGRAQVVFTKANGSGITVAVSANDDLKIWSEGHGDWNVHGDLRAYLKTLRAGPATRAETAPTAAGIRDEPQKLKQAYEAYVDENTPNAQAIGEFEAYLKEHPETVFKAEIYFWMGYICSSGVKEKFHEKSDLGKMDEYFQKAHVIWGRKFSHFNMTAWATLANRSPDVQAKIA